MPPRKKFESELKPDEDGTVVVPKEVLDPMPTISKTELSKRVPRELSEAQVNTIRRLNEGLAKKRADPKWQEEQRIKREEKKLAKAEALRQEALEALNRKRAEEEEKIKAGTHIRVKVTQSKPKPHKKPVPEKMPAPRVDDSSDFTTEVESDDEEEEEDVVETRKAQRTVRKEVKKNLKALEKIEEVEKYIAPTQAIHSNPYMSMLLSKWK